MAARILDVDATRDDLSVAPGDSYDRLMWEQTNHRHCRGYYERLKRSQAVSCFCGELIPPMPWRDPTQYLVGGNRAKLKRAFFNLLAHADPRPDRIVQWDSWRFWEALGRALFYSGRYAAAADEFQAVAQKAGDPSPRPSWMPTSTTVCMSLS